MALPLRAAGGAIDPAVSHAAEAAQGLRRAGRLGSAERVLRLALHTHPDDPALRHALAQTLLDSGRFREARGIFFSLAPAAATASLRAAILAGAGEALQGEGRASEAVAPLREARLLAPEDAEIARSLARALQSAGELREAATAWAAVRVLRPDHPEAEARRRGCLQLEADLLAARRNARRLLADAEALVRLAALEEAAARPAAAAAALGRALMSRPPSTVPQLRLRRALLLIRAGDTAAAERELHALTSTDVMVPAAWYSLAALRARAGDRRGEAKVWEAVSAAHPADLFAQRAWARAVARAGDLETARAAEARRPETPASLLRRALLAHEAGDFVASAVALAAAAGADPNDDNLAEVVRDFVDAGAGEATALRGVIQGQGLPGGLRTRGALRLWLGDGAAGLADLAAAEREHPDDPRGKVALAYAHRLAGERAAAQRLLEAAVALDPGYAPARLDLAAAHLQRGEAALSLPHAEAAALAAPESSLAQALVGAALLQLDRAEGAVLALARGLAVEPADPRSRIRPLLLRAFTRLGDHASARELLSPSVVIEPELQYQLAYARVRDSFVGDEFDPSALRLWRTRFDGTLRDDVDALAAIGALAASLDDPYTRLRSPGDAIARLETVRGGELLADPRGRVAPGSPTVLSRVLDEGVLYLRLTNLEDAGVAAQVEAALAASPDAPQVILDLRGNPGGYEHLAEEVAALLAPEEGARRIHEAREGRSPRPLREPGAARDRRLKVLVDGGTASAAEHLASALAHADSVEVVGGATSGKDVVQYPYMLPDGWTLLVTCARLAPMGAPGK